MTGMNNTTTSREEISSYGLMVVVVELKSCRREQVERNSDLRYLHLELPTKTELELMTEQKGVFRKCSVDFCGHQL